MEESPDFSPPQWVARQIKFLFYRKGRTKSYRFNLASEGLQRELMKFFHSLPSWYCTERTYYNLSDLRVGCTIFIFSYPVFKVVVHRDLKEDTFIYIDGDWQKSDVGDFVDNFSILGKDGYVQTMVFRVFALDKTLKHIFTVDRFAGRLRK